MLDKIDNELLKQVSSLHEVKQGAYNIRKNGKLEERNSTANIIIDTNNAGDGIIVKVLGSTKGESVHIPVILSKAGLNDVVKNEFIVEPGAEVTIVAGCGIHSSSSNEQSHSGVHLFNIGKNANVTYIEKHYGSGNAGNKIMNPETVIIMDEGASFVMDTAQLSGVDRSVRNTYAKLNKNAKLKITERILTEGSSSCTTNFVADLNGENSACHIISRAVGKDNSTQNYNSRLNGNNKCYGRTECDAIIVGSAKVCARPEVNALHPDASLVHEASVGKLSGEQVTKLLTLGLTEKEAEEKLLKGFLR